MQKNELFTIISESVDNPLTEALRQYKCALDRGNYKASWPEAERDWTDKDELAVVDKALLFALEKLNLQDIDRENLQTNLKNHLPIGLHKIAHLLASLTILWMQEVVEPAKELEQLKTLDVLVQVRAGMPMPCIAYLGALRCSPLNKKTKCTQIHNIIIDLLSDMNKFGLLSNIALRVAIQDWLNVLDELGPDFKEKFSSEIKEYRTKLRNCPTVSETQEQLTIIEKYILNSCQQLKNGIGQIQDSVTREPKESSSLKMTPEPQAAMVIPADTSTSFFGSPKPENVQLPDENTNKELIDLLVGTYENF